MGHGPGRRPPGPPNCGSTTTGTLVGRSSFAVVSFVVALAGVAAFSQHRESAAIAMVRHSVNLPFPGRPAIRIGPGLPGHFVLAQGGPLQALGLVMLVAGLVGLGLTLWLWKPWSGTRRRSSIDEDAGLPSYL